MKRSMLAALSLSFAVTGCYTDRHTENARTEPLPANVHSRIQEEIGDARIVHVDRERRLGNWVYDVTYLQDGYPQSIEVRQDGAVLRENAPEVMEEAAGAVVYPGSY